MAAWKHDSSEDFVVKLPLSLFGLDSWISSNCVAFAEPQLQDAKSVAAAIKNPSNNLEVFQTLPTSANCNKDAQANPCTQKQSVQKVKKFACRALDCAKQFCSKSQLRRHELIHGSEKWHFCPVCSRLFTFAYNLKVHMRRHTGERPYTCRFVDCKRKFKHHSSLRVHEQTHSNEVWQFN